MLLSNHITFSDPRRGRGSRKSGRSRGSRRSGRSRGSSRDIWVVTRTENRTIHRTSRAWRGRGSGRSWRSRWSIDIRISGCIDRTGVRRWRGRRGGWSRGSWWSSWGYRVISRAFFGCVWRGTRSWNKGSTRGCGRGWRGWRSRIGIVGINITSFNVFMYSIWFGIILISLKGKDCVQLPGVGAAIAVRLRPRIMRTMLGFIFVLLSLSCCSPVLLAEGLYEQRTRGWC